GEQLRARQVRQAHALADREARHIGARVLGLCHRGMMPHRPRAAARLWTRRQVCTTSDAEAQRLVTPWLTMKTHACRLAEPACALFGIWTGSTKSPCDRGDAGDCTWRLSLPCTK